MATFAFNVGRNKSHADDLRQVAGEFGDLAAFVLSTANCSSKDGPYVAGPFANNRRDKANAVPRSWVALDLDKIADAVEMASIIEAAEAWRGIGYTTHSHNPAAGAFKVRLVLAADRAISPAEYGRLCSGLAAELGRLAAVPVVRDTACDKIEQPLFTVRAGATTWQFDGDPVAVDAVIDPEQPSQASAGANPDGSTHADWLDQLLDGDNVHDNAVRLVGHLVATGMNDKMIKATMAALAIGVAQARGPGRADDLLGGELDRMIKGARGKGFAPPPSPEIEGVELVYADQVTIEPIRWLWREYLAAGKVHISAGAPGTGKTTIAVSLAAIISTGGYWPDGTRAAAGNVLIWSGEDDPADTLVPRLRAMGANLARIAFVDGANEIINGKPRRVAFDPSKHLDALASRIASEPPALLIVDPIVSAVAGDSHKNAETRRGLQPLVDIARLHGVAVLGITHFSKGTQGRDPTERVTGSLAFGALARVVFICSKVREGSRVFMRAKSNIGPDEGGFEYDLEQTAVPGHSGMFASVVAWGAVVEGNAREVLADAEAQPDEQQIEPPEPTATDDAIEALREVLGAGEMVRSEVMATMKGAGFSDKVIRLAREHIGVVMRRAGSGKTMRSLWSLPEFAHSCPDEPFEPPFPNSEIGAQMPCEGTNDPESAIDSEVFS